MPAEPPVEGVELTEQGGDPLLVDREDRPEAADQRRIDDVLARRAEMHELPVDAAHLLAQLPHELDANHPVARRRLTQSRRYPA